MSQFVNIFSSRQKKKYTALLALLFVMVIGTGASFYISEKLNQPLNLQPRAVSGQGPSTLSCNGMQVLDVSVLESNSCPVIAGLNETTGAIEPTAGAINDVSNYGINVTLKNKLSTSIDVYATIMTFFCIDPYGVKYENISNLACVGNPEIKTVKYTIAGGGTKTFSTYTPIQLNEICGSSQSDFNLGVFQSDFKLDVKGNGISDCYYGKNPNDQNAIGGWGFCQTGKTCTGFTPPPTDAISSCTSMTTQVGNDAPITVNSATSPNTVRLAQPGETVKVSSTGNANYSKLLGYYLRPKTIPTGANDECMFYGLRKSPPPGQTFNGSFNGDEATFIMPDWKNTSTPLYRNDMGEYCKLLSAPNNKLNFDDGFYIVAMRTTYGDPGRKWCKNFGPLLSSGAVNALNVPVSPAQACDNFCLIQTGTNISPTPTGNILTPTIFVPSPTGVFYSPIPTIPYYPTNTPYRWPTYSPFPSITPTRYPTYTPRPTYTLQPTYFTYPSPVYRDRVVYQPGEPQYVYLQSEQAQSQSQYQQVAPQQQQPLSLPTYTPYPTYTPFPNEQPQEVIYQQPPITVVVTSNPPLAQGKTQPTSYTYPEKAQPNKPTYTLYPTQIPYTPVAVPKKIPDAGLPLPFIFVAVPALLVALGIFL